MLNIKPNPRAELWWKAIKSDKIRIIVASRGYLTSAYQGGKRSAVDRRMCFPIVNNQEVVVHSIVCAIAARRVMNLKQATDSLGVCNQLTIMNLKLWASRNFWR